MAPPLVGEIGANKHHFILGAAYGRSSGAGIAKSPILPASRAPRWRADTDRGKSRIAAIRAARIPARQGVIFVEQSLHDRTFCAVLSESISSRCGFGWTDSKSTLSTRRHRSAVRSDCAIFFRIRRARLTSHFARTRWHLISSGTAAAHVETIIVQITRFAPERAVVFRIG